MITGALKSKIDSIWNTMWSGGISNPLSVIEQLTYLLFIKRLDELHTLKERKAAHTGTPIEEPVFGPDQDRLRWSRFKNAAPEQLFETMRDGVFPFIKSLGQKGEANAGEGGSTYSHHMKDALFMMPTARVLANVVDQLDGIDMADSDTSRHYKFLKELAGAYHGRASVYSQRGDVGRAMEDLEKALDLNPHLPAALIDRGNLHRDNGALEDAIRDFSAVLGRSRSGSQYTWFRDGHFYRALARCIQNDWPGAESDLESARREGLRVASSFRNIFGGVARFEAEYDLRMPSIAATMLYVA